MFLARPWGYSPWLAIGLCIVLTVVFGCASRNGTATQGDVAMSDHAIYEVIRRHTDSLMNLSGVLGIGQGRCNDEPCIKIFVESVTSEVEAIPDTLDGYPVEVEVTGRITAASQAG